MKYSVSIEVVYTDIVEADSEEEAIDIVMANCPYDFLPSYDPCVEIIGE